MRKEKYLVTRKYSGEKFELVINEGDKNAIYHQIQLGNEIKFLGYEE